ncbi:MAG: CsbD family protein [Paracoccaceae bacterium]
MNWDQIEGTWKQYAGKAKAKWGELTDDELTEAKGRRDEMIGLIQKRYGKARDVAEREVDEWTRSL